MARYPNARWQPSPNHGGALTRSLGLVLHVEQGSEAGTAAWFCNPKSQASSHFGVAKTGAVDQFVDTSLQSWAQAAGNASYWSVETEGFATEPLTDAQVQAVADLYRWLHSQPEAAFDFVLAEKPGGLGLGWHGMGAAAWGGHTGCPGDLRKAQRARILTLAHPSAPPPPPPPPPPSSKEVTGVKITAGTIPVAALDDQGHGWVSIPAPIARVLFIGTQGSAPARDGAYWAPVGWTVNDSGAETVVDLYGQAHQATVVYYSTLTEE